MLRWLGIFAVLLVAATALAPPDAEAGRRFGGGRSAGMKRELPPQQAPAARPDRADQQPGAAPARSGLSRWLGPLVGFGLGALFMSMFGGSALAGFLGNLLMIGLLFVAVRFIIRMWQGKHRLAAPPMRYAGATAGGTTGDIDRLPAAGGVSAAAPRRYPEGFDVAGFLREAKVSFIRLQAANDAGDLNDVRNYTTPELYAEIAMQIQERGAVKQRVEVTQLEAELLEVLTEGEREIASVQFSGLIREDEAAGVEAFTEVWHVVKDANDAKAPWMIAGIQQR